jgi:hypothetical protein
MICEGAQSQTNDPFAKYSVSSPVEVMVFEDPLYSIDDIISCQYSTPQTVFLLRRYSELQNLGLKFLHAQSSALSLQVLACNWADGGHAKLLMDECYSPAAQGGQTTQASGEELGEGSGKPPSSTSSEKSQRVGPGPSREKYIWEDHTLV